MCASRVQISVLFAGLKKQLGVSLSALWDD